MQSSLQPYGQAGLLIAFFGVPSTFLSAYFSGRPGSSRGFGKSHPVSHIIEKVTEGRCFFGVQTDQRLAGKGHDLLSVVVPYHPGIQRFTHALKTLFHRRHYQTRCSARHQIETQERDAKFHTPRVKLCRSLRRAWPGHAKTGGGSSRSSRGQAKAASVPRRMSIACLAANRPCRGRPARPNADRSMSPLPARQASAGTATSS